MVVNSASRSRPRPHHIGVFAPIRSVHFTGICGTAMASVAVAMKERGISAVTGSDQNVYPPHVDVPGRSRGIEVMAGVLGVEPRVSAPDLVVVGNAISRGNPEAEAVLERKLRYCVAARGPAGLSSCTGEVRSSSAARTARRPPRRCWPGSLSTTDATRRFLIGGIPTTSAQGARFTDSEWFIIEGDEYDTAFFDKRSKFIHYLPEVAIVNNLEFDHADIFENLAAIQKTFSHFIRLIPRNGLLLGQRR
jgi:UDP-N-acetylmuramate: L-alanyl-gamma-D-glutamyl-meso-diaminopimelate ligase